MRVNGEIPGFSKPRKGALSVRTAGATLLETFDAQRPYVNLKALSASMANEADAVLVALAEMD